MFALVLILIAFVSVVAFMPNYLGHPDNYIEANALVTPAHIVPEWYLLPFLCYTQSLHCRSLGSTICDFYIWRNNYS
ncbi:MAG: hypothetical protein ACJ0DD_00715 [Paracoccaceae bacterium]